MRLTQLDLRHFAGLDLQLELAPGLNVIFGANESGKSRIVQGAMAALTGRVRKRGRGQDELERFRPWAGGAFRVDARLRLASGRTLEVRQELDEPARSKVTDVELGRDVTSEFIVERAPDLSRALGLTRTVVPLTVVVRQTEIAALSDGASALQEMLQKAAAREATDTTANRAIERLQQLQSESIGTERANSRRPLREATQAESEARRHREEVLRLQREVRVEREELANLTRALEATRLQRDYARHAEITRDIERLQTRLDRVHQLEVLLAAPTPEPIHLSDSLRERLTDLARWAREATPPTPPEIDLRELDAARGLLLTLPQRPIGDLAIAEPVSRAHRAVVIAKGALEAHEAAAPALETGSHHPHGPPLRDPEPDRPLDPHRLRSLASALEVPPPGSPEVPLSQAQGRPWLVLACVGVLAGLPLATLGFARGSAFVITLGILCLITGIGCFGLARRHGRANARHEALIRSHEADVALHDERLEAVRRELATLGFMSAMMTASHLRSEANRLELGADHARRAVQWRERRAQLQTALEVAEAALTRELASRDATTFEDYAASCAKRVEASHEASRRPDLERIVRQADASLAAYDRARVAYDAKCGALSDALSQAGMPNADPASPAVRAELEALLKRCSQTERLLAERGALLEEHTRTIDGQAVPDLEAQLGLLRAERSALDARLGPDARAPASHIDSKRATHDLDAAQHDLARRVGQLEARVEQVPSLAEADEACDRTQQEVDRLRRYDRLIAHAIRLLTESRDHVHRDIAPRLSTSVSRILPKLTNSRWNEARLRVDTLAVSVRDHDATWRDAAHLSVGALEQVHLALRTVLASAIGDPNEPAPLVLDDILTHSDPTRRDATLDWLLTLAESVQVVLTTTDPEVLAWSNMRGVHLITLGDG